MLIIHFSHKVHFSYIRKIILIKKINPLGLYEASLGKKKSRVNGRTHAGQNNLMSSFATGHNKYTKRIIQMFDKALIANFHMKTKYKYLTMPSMSTIFNALQLL